MHLPDFILFASEATIYGMWGGALLAISAFASWREHRRRGRKDINRVGIMPWRDIGALTGFAGLALMAFAGVGWIGGA